MTFSLDNNKKITQRQVYNFMQLLSDIGGFNGIIITLIGFIVNNVCLKNKTSQYDTVKKAFPIKR